MNFSISPQIRIVALVGLVLVVAAGGASMMLGHSGSSNPSTSAPPLHRHAPPTKVTIKSKNGKTVVKTGHRAGVQHVHRTVVTPKTKATAKAAAKSATKTKTTVVHTNKHTTVVRRSGNLVYADLPAPLQWQLAKHHIVVVSIYNPTSDVDAISVAEAHAGATEAGAGFLLVSVLDNSVAGPLTALLPGGGLLPDPGILIYRSPGNMAMRIDGFVDRDAVAQAASNAFAGQNSPLTSTDSSSSSSGSYGATP